MSTVNISIDKSELAKRITWDVLAPIYAYTPIHVAMSTADDVKLDFDRGWWKVDYRTRGYVKISPLTVFVPWGIASDTQAWIFGVVIYVKTLFDVYLAFAERRPGDATTRYHGLYLSSGGTLSYRAYPSEATSGTTSASVSAGDILLALMVAGNYGGYVYHTMTVAKYDWATDSATTIIDAVSRVGSATAQETVRYLCISEQNYATGKLAFTSYTFGWSAFTSAPTTGPGIDWILQYIRKLRELGIADPATLTW